MEYIIINRLEIAYVQMRYEYIEIRNDIDFLFFPQIIQFHFKG